MGYFEGWFDNDGSVIDESPPTITKVSPASFDADYSVARVTPVVIDITDATPGVDFIVVTSGSTLVYYGTPTGSWGADYTGSSFTAISGGYRLSILPTAGWPSGALSLLITGIDSHGNLATLTVSLTVPSAAQDSLQASTWMFRDSVWRWRRRLSRPRCSVVSVAIDDNYTEGPGFILTALALEIGRKTGLDRVPWRAGTTTSVHGTTTISNGR